MIRFIVMTLCCASTGVLAESPSWIVPKVNDVGLYLNETRAMNERAIARVGTGDRLVVLDESSSSFLVKDTDANLGWIEKRLVVSAAGTRQQFEAIDVSGVIETPMVIHVAGQSDRKDILVTPDRSFQQSLCENATKEVIDRTVCCR